jgi:hypothetical protein
MISTCDRDDNCAAFTENHQYIERLGRIPLDRIVTTRVILNYLLQSVESEQEECNLHCSLKDILICVHELHFLYFTLLANSR